jgi:hypothetical protein
MTSSVHVSARRSINCRGLRRLLYVLRGTAGKYLSHWSAALPARMRRIGSMKGVLNASQAIGRPAA